MNISIPIANTMEYIQNTVISPLISKGFCKVCYVQDEPNRNKTVLNKKTVAEMGRQLPGSPVVGYFNKDENDFEGHNREIIVDKGKFEIVDVTRPYGFVPTDATVWFQKFTEDNIEREYLCCDVYIWTGAYPESNRILEKGNNQSMELSKENYSGFWTNDNKTNARIFIYNEALIEKLCILGENIEPCFEGAQIRSNFSLQNFEELKTTMISELQETMSKGGNSQMLTEYAVEIGCALWDSIYNIMENRYPDTSKDYKCSIYSIEGVFEEEGKKFVVLKHKVEGKLYQLFFDIDANENFVFSEELVEVTQTFVPSDNPQYDLKSIETYEQTRYAKVESQEEEIEEEEATYNLEEISEYVELKAQFSALEEKYFALENEYKTAKEDLKALKEFKLIAERKEKQAMIDSFYMLSDKDKEEVVQNIDTYSLSDIEAKLSVICFRNKVDFNVNESNEPQGLFNLNASVASDNAPDWVKALREMN